MKIVKLNGELFLRSSSSASSSTVPKNLGTACQNIWNAAAGNNLRVPSELFVDLAGRNPLFTVNGAGVDKINTLEFITFKGKIHFCQCDLTKHSDRVQMEDRSQKLLGTLRYGTAKL